MTIKRFLFFILFFPMTLLVYAQSSKGWTVQDSVRLQKLLNSDKEIKINKDVVKMIDFGGAVSDPQMSTDKQWMNPDESFPDALPKSKVILSLMPYKATTRFNWDPIYQKKIRIDKNTWRGDPFYEMRQQKTYSNWAKSPMSAGERNSVDEIRSSGVRYNMLGERANGMLVNTMQMNKPLYLGGSGVYVSGATIGGLDLMAPFTREFWNKSGRRTRARTLEVLRTYGDSTTIMINQPIEHYGR